MSLGEIAFAFFIFPGFLFTAFAGCLSSWVDRKVTARIQWRVGPPWYQPFADILKLLGKETIVPMGVSKPIFLLAPVVGLSAVTLVSTIVWLVNFSPAEGFVGDLIVVIYLFVIPSLALMLGGLASRNPYASFGALREMKLVMAYELPFLIAVLVPVIKTGGMIRLGEIIQYQVSNGAMLSRPSGVLAFVAALFCMQAKLGLVPFDIAEAETEIMAGPIIEYSGTPLAVQKLSRLMLLFVLPVFLVTLYWGGLTFDGWNIVWSVLKYVFVLVIIILLRNTNPRLRIDQAMRFFWGPVLIVSVLGVVTAFLGF